MAGSVKRECRARKNDQDSNCRAKAQNFDIDFMIIITMWFAWLKYHRIKSVLTTVNLQFHNNRMRVIKNYGKSFLAMVKPEISNCSYTYAILICKIKNIIHGSQKSHTKKIFLLFIIVNRFYRKKTRSFNQLIPKLNTS